MPKRSPFIWANSNSNTGHISEEIYVLQSLCKMLGIKIQTVRDVRPIYLGSLNETFKYKMFFKRFVAIKIAVLEGPKQVEIYFLAGFLAAAFFFGVFLAGFLAAGFLAAGFLAFLAEDAFLAAGFFFLGVDFFAAGFFAEAFLAAGFLAAAFFGVAFFLGAAFFLGSAFLTALKDPEAPVPFVSSKAPVAIPLLRANLRWVLTLSPTL